MTISAQKVIIRWDHENWIWRMEYQGPSRTYTIRTTLKRPIDYNASDRELKALAAQELSLDGLALPLELSIIRRNFTGETTDDKTGNKITASSNSSRAETARKTIGRR
ncbi:hypothetical protein KAR91_04660 [Candidatus Pacearchaeota archaeon]|nr:hypothetical protein [Candidatus Pacearchaeota archaeon]